MNRDKTTLHTMKAYLIRPLFLLIILIAVQSCLDKDDNDYYAWNDLLVSYGVFDKDNNTISTDEGRVLNFPSSGLKIADNKRVVVAYSIESSSLSGYNVNLYAIDTVLTKRPVHSTCLNNDEKRSLGNSPVNMIKAWFSRNEYLNVEFDFLRAHPNIAHYINLYVDEEASTEERKVLVFRHNNYSDPEYTWASARASFKIDYLIPRCRDSIKIVLKWENYNGVARSDSGYFGVKPKIMNFNENKECPKENSNGFDEYDNTLK